MQEANSTDQVELICNVQDFLLRGEGRFFRVRELVFPSNSKYRLDVPRWSYLDTEQWTPKEAWLLRYRGGWF